MGKEGMCPGCGAEDETILHLFQCNDDRMRNTLQEEITKAETKLAKANVPVRIYKHFFELYRETCKLESQHYEIECEEADIARQVQESLGEEAIVRGFLVKEWTEAIEKYWRAPQTHPGEKNPPKQRSPYQMGVLLQETVWSIFEEVWAKRNSILHEPNNHVDRAEMDSITRKLLDYKQNSMDLLSPHDQNCVDYPEITIVNWTLRQKKDHLKRLNKRHKAWKQDCKHRREGQKRIYEIKGWEAHNPYSTEPDPEPDPEPEEDRERSEYEV